QRATFALHSCHAPGAFPAYVDRSTSKRERICHRRRPLRSLTALIVFERGSLSNSSVEVGIKALTVSRLSAPYKRGGLVSSCSSLLNEDGTVGDLVKVP